MKKIKKKKKRKEKLFSEITEKKTAFDFWAPGRTWTTL